MKKTMALFLILLGGPVWGASQPSINTNLTGDQILKKAQSYLYVREQKPRNGNRSPEIDSWLKYIGLPPGLSYCITFDIYCIGKTFEEKGKRCPVPKIGHCGRFLKSVKADKYAYTIYTPKQVELGIVPVKPADMLIWSHNKTIHTEKSYYWPGHAEFIESKKLRTSVNTIGANTTGVDSINSQREQSGKSGPIGGVWRKTRKLGAYAPFNPEAIVRINGVK